MVLSVFHPIHAALNVSHLGFDNGYIGNHIGKLRPVFADIVQDHPDPDPDDNRNQAQDYIEPQ